MTDIMSQQQHNENKEDFEDGELPEDGEICDDEEEKAPAPAPTTRISPTKPSLNQNQQSKPSAPSASSEKQSSRDREPRVRRFEQKSPKREQDPDPFGSHTDAPDAGNEYFGDKDYRAAGAAASSEEEPFSDTDYRQNNRRRRLSPAHDDQEYESRSKRPFFGGGRGGFRGGFRGGPKPRFQTEHQICKFFREGYCRDGDQCSYSHQAEDSLRRPVLCNFYANSFCKKGLQCLMLHGEFPCKQFHKGLCNNDQCRFSHVPLTDYTRPIIEKILADEESRQPRQPTVYPQNPVANAAAAATAAAIMQPRRRVLLPGGPAANGMSPPHAAPIIHVPVPQPVHPSQLPPPQVVVPTLQRNPTPQMHQYAPNNPLMQQQQSGGYFNQGPRPDQVQGLPPPRTIEPPRLSSQMAPQGSMRPMMGQQPQVTHLQQPGLVLPPQVSSMQQERKPEPQPAFNLEAMLNKLANGSSMRSSPKPAMTTDDSPASPPPFSTLFAPKSKIAMIPQTQQTQWGVIRVLRRAPYSNVENAERIPTNDPRRAKAIAKQFDAISSMIGGIGSAASVVSDPRLRAKKETPVAKPAETLFSSWMPQMS
ncbi:hypothetical protein CAEBREN_30953 [Caenorhabditis brenneri]|uniref:C3H1-type domain-containing protein n=1 Tax=Caenorhabditis brenneri TaxID=135651 RepID=G0PCI3_CAEBE|nr:hypothetical protein CAEBREN_30953 [Caenorhabditis brenneri]